MMNNCDWECIFGLSLVRVLFSSLLSLDVSRSENARKSIELFTALEYDQTTTTNKCLSRNILWSNKASTNRHRALFSSSHINQRLQQINCKKPGLDQSVRSSTHEGRQRNIRCKTKSRRLCSRKKNLSDEVAETHRSLKGEKLDYWKNTRSREARRANERAFNKPVFPRSTRSCHETVSLTNERNVAQISSRKTPTKFFLLEPDQRGCHGKIIFRGWYLSWTEPISERERETKENSVGKKNMSEIVTSFVSCHSSKGKPVALTKFSP